MVKTLFRTSMLGSVLWLAGCGGRDVPGDLADAGALFSDAGGADSGGEGWAGPEHAPGAGGKRPDTELAPPRFPPLQPGGETDGHAPQPLQPPELGATQQNTPDRVPGVPLQCTMGGVQITPDLSPTDQCMIPFTCASGTRVEITCDGENDGTFTSLCSCYIDGKYVGLDGLFVGEAPDSCFAAVDKCLKRLP